MSYELVSETDRVPSMRVRLDPEREARFAKLVDDLLMIDVHEHPIVLPSNLDDVVPYLRSQELRWGYDAVRRGGWTAVGTANVMSCYAKCSEPAFAHFEDLVNEIELMLADLDRHQVPVLTTASAIVEMRRRGTFGFLPTVEFLAIDADIERVDILYDLGVRVAGLTYSKQSFIGSGQSERSDVGLSLFGRDVVTRMNEIGMLIDLSHASGTTALDAIEYSRQPVVFSHNAAYGLRQSRRARHDRELLACAEKGGLVCVTAVPNALSDDPRQDINCVLDHIDYFVKLVGLEHVGIGTDTIVGDHVGTHHLFFSAPLGGAGPRAPYLDGLESPADGTNIVRGLLDRGYSDEGIRMICGTNALDLLRRVIG